MKRIPIVIQLIFILLLLFLIPTVMTGYYSNVQMMKYSEEEIATSAMAQIDTSSSYSEAMLMNIVKNILQMVGTNEFNGLKNLTSYEVLNSEYSKVNVAVGILDQMREIQNNNRIVSSIYFCLDGADYVISTNRGIVKNQAYEDIAWMDELELKGLGSAGIWYARTYNTATLSELANGKTSGEMRNVISYIYRLNKLTTSTKGTIVVNVDAQRLNELLLSSLYSKEAQGIMVMTDGTIISHKESSKFLKKFGEIEYVKESLASGITTGYQYQKDGERAILLTYQKSPQFQWIYVNTYNMDTLMSKAQGIRSGYTVFILIIIALGTIVVVVLARGFSKPMRKLVQNVKQLNGMEELGVKNELSYLSGAIEKIQEQESELHHLLKEKELEARNLLLHNLLTGEITNQKQMEELEKIFPYNHYMVAIISIDNTKLYLETTGKDKRGIQRFTLQDKIKKAFSEGYHVESMRNGAGMMAIIINMKSYDYVKVSRELFNILTGIRQEAQHVFEYTVSIGVSTVHNGYELINECHVEALEAIKRRIIVGRNQIIFWNPQKKENNKYSYSYNGEKKIINYLSVGDADSAKAELSGIFDDIKHKEDISYENLLLILNQLTGATVKFMMEHNMNTSKVFGNNTNLYQTIGGMDTLEDIEVYLGKVFISITDYLMSFHEDTSEKSSEQIIKYLRKHYKEEIVFEELATQIGISYSYMRKMIREETGNSLMDNVNLLRIDEAKRLLLHSDLSLTQIATEVGYHNVQSLNRFFKKYEGVSPSDFKNNIK
ncbi:AraC family transcriptional regulator [Lachnoclostridium phytofermentans]|uniref:AraC family transcriptional regulator n=1 Tax=Lachnoclostridium phytofermentans TaxID=66219 RepID=UPI00049858AB|nr:AraC family transcriptional regulator [Lachnoclostridium phytofermentans]